MAQRNRVLVASLLLLIIVSQHKCKTQEIIPSTDSSRYILQQLYPGLISLLSDWTEYESWKESNDSCQSDSANYLAALSSIFSSGSANESSDDWALKIFDATGKPPTGVLQGNVKWLGTFTECLKISVPKPNSTDVAFKGQYCSALVTTKQTNDTHILKSSADGFVKVFASAGLSVGVCWPSSCSAEQVEEQLNDLLAQAKITSVSLTVSPDSCSVHKPTEYDGSAIAVIVLFSAFGLVMIAGTIIDIWCNFKKSHKENNQSILSETSVARRILVSFSVYKNGKKILNTQQSEGTLTALHGIRFISMTWVILGHTYEMITRIPLKNPSDMRDMIKDILFDAVLNGPFSVDTFYFLSGFLVTFVFLREMLKSNGHFGLQQFFLYYFHRFWRLTPAYAVSIAFLAGLFSYVATGPFWVQITSSIVDNCQKYWWRNLLYIQNLYDDNHICNGVTWYLGTDMQFYVVALVILIPLYKKPTMGLIVMGVFFIVTTLSAGLIIHFEDTLAFALEDTFAELSSDRARKYMTHVYNKPWCRMGPYLLGMFLAYVLHYKRMRITLRPIYVAVGWVLAAALGLVLVCGNYHYFTGESIMSNALRSTYGALSKSAWGLFMFWVVFACVTGQGGFINTLLSWKAFVPLSRLTYSAYLVHFHVIIAFFASQEAVLYLNHFFTAIIFLGILAITMGIAFVFSLAFEAPMMELEKIFLPQKRKDPAIDPQSTRPQNVSDHTHDNNGIEIPISSCK